MLFTLEVIDPTAMALFSECEKSLQRFGKAELIDKTSLPSTRLESDGYLTIIPPSGKPSRYVCEARQRINLDALALVIDRLRQSEHATGAKPLLLTPYVNDSLGDRLRASGIAYLDAVGNACLVEPPIYIWLRGFKPTEQPERTTRAFQSTGLQLIALLLSSPQAVELPYRKLEEEAGISLGSISHILGDLRSLGFIRLVGPDKNEIANRRKLLEQWEFGYATRLRPQLNPMNYRQANAIPVEELPQKLPASMKDDVLIGGELGAAIATQHLRPQTATIHIRNHRPILPLIKEMRLIPDRQGNIVLIEQFGNLSAWIWKKHEKDRLVHPFLIYAELIHGKPDDRLLETAKLIFDENLAPIIDNEPTAIPT